MRFVCSLPLSISHSILVGLGCYHMVRQAILRIYLKVAHPLCRVLDTVTIVLDTHAVYFYLIANYNNPSALSIQVWCVRHRSFLDTRRTDFPPLRSGVHRYVAMLPWSSRRSEARTGGSDLYRECLNDIGAYSRCSRRHVLVSTR